MLRETEYIGFQHQMYTAMQRKNHQKEIKQCWTTDNPRRGFFGEKQIKLDSNCKMSIAFSNWRFPVIRKRFQNRDGKTFSEVKKLNIKY